MQDMAKDVARQTAPWKAGQSWWVAGIEGIVALVVGVYIVTDPRGASDIIRFLIAVVLLIDSVGQIGDGFRARDLPASPWETLRGGIGATVAALTLLSAWWGDIGDTGARRMLAVGLLVYGILGVVTRFVTFRTAGFNVAAVIADVLTIVLGILLLAARPDDTSGTRLLGLAAIAGGIALLIYSWVLRGQTARDAGATVPN